MKIPESAIQSHIMQYMTKKGWYVQRQNSGMVKSERGGMVRLAPVGTPDLLCIKDGRILFIEVKNEKGKVTELQQQKMEELRGYGAECIVARSIEDVENYLL